MTNVYDLIDPDDLQRRTYRQINAEKRHKILLGTLVELPDGCRAWVVHLGRDCDQTPLYWVSLDCLDFNAGSKPFANTSWRGGFNEEDLKVVKKPEHDTRVKRTRLHVQRNIDQDSEELELFDTMEQAFDWAGKNKKNYETIPFRDKGYPQFTVSAEWVLLSEVIS